MVSALHESTSPTLVVGIGASAGWLDATRRVLASLPPSSGIALIVVLHLDPTHDSQLAQILGEHCILPVTQVTESTRIEADHVYVIAPNTSLTVEDGDLRPGPHPDRGGEPRVIDLLLSALARAYGPQAAAVILSGLGSDGSHALAHIREAGGVCVAQDPETALHDSMPRAAIATGHVDAILAPEAITPFLLTQPEANLAPSRGESSLLPDRSATRPPGFEQILGLLAHHHGFAPRNYKEGTLRRRASRRLGRMPFSGWLAYAHYLEEHPEELAALYQDVLVGVTQFFRDPHQWSYLEREIVPRLIAEHNDPHRPIRVWTAGCATGEEAYSLAMLLLERLDDSASIPRVQVFATDVSHEALAVARRGTYPASIVDEVSPERLQRFFTEHGESYQITRELRDTVTLARHDLLTEPPFCRLDLVCCRNLFIYLEPHAQQDCIQRFHFALQPGGVLWLGSAESINGQTELFSTLAPKYRMYRRVELHRRGAAMPWNVRPSLSSSLSGPLMARPSAGLAARNATRLTRAIERFLLDRYATACVVINQIGHVLHLFGPTTDYLSQPRGEVRLDLLSWVPPSVYAKLRPALKEALEQRKTVIVGGAQVQRGTRNVRTTCTIEPISMVAEGLYLVTFQDDEPPPSPERLALHPASADVDEPLVRQLTQQLQEAQTELRSALEDLDNANEEYRASYEELVSLNEELQSSNEELETTKEEAQSINEELLTLNRELEERNTSLHTVNADLENLLEVTSIPTIFLDRQLCVRRFTPAVQRVMWLVASDVGRPLEHITRRVDDETLLDDALEVLEQLLPIEAEVRSEDGRWYLRRVVPFRSGDRIDGVCMTFYDITPQKLAAEKSEEARYVAESIVRSSRLPFVVFDHELTVVTANDVFCDAFGIPKDQAEGCTLQRLDDGRWDVPPLREMLQRLLHIKADVQDYEIVLELEPLGLRHLHLNASLMERRGRMPLLLLSLEDVTPLREAQIIAQRRAEELEQEHRRKDEFLAMLGHELRNPLAALANGLAIIEQDGLDPLRLRAIHPMLVRQTTRMTAMLDQLLDISRVISGKIELQLGTIDLVDVVTAAVEAMQPMVDGACHRLVTDFPPPASVLAQGDMVRLIQVVENLLSNAIKYTENRGTIWLTVEANDDAARIRVKDTGIGIDAELLPYVFDVFTQGPQNLDRSKGGMGLGLPLVRLLVSMHGGRVEASSAGAGQGSELIVTLPRLGSGVPSPASTSTPSTGIAPRRRVLVIDDERDSADMLVELLRLHGHEAKAIYDGRVAAATVGEYHPDVVLLDLGLPHIDGYQVARVLRAQEYGTSHLRIVALTGYQREPERLHEAGFDDHLIKPLDPKKLAVILDGRGLLSVDPADPA
ncbi:CheR family methyltransferase [Paraliomyxa miuraensis]|uniref:CheR family methyltransferase n=1 Tax=Paraliomyxa miuraensis TaxID=376150 RepID=UPI00225A9818|nr:CheR family methyltransferase [Paraliomyxa miuraensis]MCX4242047.1 ATP-binding protein [Paraliomyxa miuraensis]